MQINNQPLLVAQAKETINLSSWIHHQDSLTDKLIGAKGNIRLNLVSQQWVQPNWWDRSLLKINDDFIYQREIIMSSQGVDYWYARTVIPQICFDTNPQFFKRLEHESIRNLIFGTDEVHRENFVCYPVDQQCLEFYWVKNHIKTIRGPLWVRFSEYSLQKKEPFYLIEILLPELEGVV